MSLANSAAILLFAGALSPPLFGQPAAPPKLSAPGSADAPQLAPSLLDTRCREIKTTSAWGRQRKLILQQWQDFLGKVPTRKPPLKTQILATEELSRFTHQRVRYQVEDGLFTDGYLLTPKGAARKLPAIVIFHPTTSLQAKAVAGEDRHLKPRLRPSQP